LERMRVEMALARIADYSVDHSVEGIARLEDGQHQVEPDPGEMAQRYGAATTALDWSARLVCSRCGSRQIDMVVTGGRRRG
jgi:hypothetical protein